MLTCFDRLKLAFLRRDFKGFIDLEVGLSIITAVIVLLKKVKVLLALR